MACLKMINSNKIDTLPNAVYFIVKLAHRMDKNQFVSLRILIFSNMDCISKKEKHKLPRLSL